MTMQANEIMDYRGKNYSMYDYPLEPFKEQHPEFPFPGRCSAAWRGYQGYWKIEQDKLYLCSLGWAQHTMEELFGHAKPVFANWYSGALKLGIGKEKHNVFRTVSFHEDVLQFMVKDGIIVSKQMIKEFDEYDFNSPCKYDETILQYVICGKMNNMFPVDYEVKQYIETLTHFFTKDDYKRRIEIPVLPERYGYINQNLSDYFLDNRQVMVTDCFIAIEKVNDDSYKDRTPELLSQLLEDILRADFSSMQTLSKNGFENAAIADEAMLLNPDTKYLEQAVFEEEDFYIPPHLIRKDRIINLLKTFEINRLNSTIFEYKPVLVNQPLVINESVRRVNAEKFCKKYGAVYEEAEDIYLPAMSQEKLREEYGYLLD